MNGNETYADQIDMSPLDNPMVLFVLHRLERNRDCRIIITASGSMTGVGKSLLAIMIGREIQDSINWYFNTDYELSEDDMYIDVWRYINEYDDHSPGKVVLHDEMETAFENRRGTTKRNVQGTQRYYTMRAKQVVTIGTAPSLSNLDKRIPQNFDIWVNITAQGEAYLYYLRENDWGEGTLRLPFKRGGEHITLNWVMPDKNSRTKALKSDLDQKKDNVHDDDVNQNQDVDEDEDESESFRQVRQQLIDVRKEYIKQNYPSQSQKDIAFDLDISQSTVSDYIDDMKREGEIETAG